MWTALFLASLPLVAAPGPQEGTSDVVALCERFTGFDLDGDGHTELERLEPLGAQAGSGPRVVVLVEERLLDEAAGAAGWDLRPRVARLVADLAAEGRSAVALSVRLGASARHQDGLYVLALREALRAFAAEGELAGALLVGHFPDAFIVRTVNWRKRGDITLRKGAGDEAVHRGVRYVRRVPEDVAHRADLVLADLDGRWEDVYVQPRTGLEAVTAVYADAIPAAGGPCVDLERRDVEFEDFFHVSDGTLEMSERGDAEGEHAGWSLILDDRAGGHELAPSDRKRPTAIARPDISVGRLDARGAALRPRADLVGVGGEGLLDEEGRPQAVQFASAKDIPHWSKVWEHDPVLERRLLAEYLDRNHAYRTDTADVVRRPASISHGFGSGLRVIGRAADDWAAADQGGADPALASVIGHPSLERFVEWMGYPALLRTIRAHSDPWGTRFDRPDIAALEELAGGTAWSWSREGDNLVPSLHDACRTGKLDWFLLRTLWENGALSDEPAFYHHTGCHGISPPYAKIRAFDHPTYGVRQGGEALLLFGRGLALIGRAKVFYDEPKRFAETLAAGGTWGDAWRRYYEEESKAPTWSKAGGDIGRKRAYFWSVLGDWTLTLRPAVQ
ncbi:MAG: hypothetical protein VX460_10460 [Planctomycetota bacterium]|nr:hypothetical protein [Planctomycetota bacterium]